MITRRGFLGAMAGSTAAFSVPEKAKRNSVHGRFKAFDEFGNYLKPYRGYQLRWTGWIESQAMDALIGRWTAYPIDNQSLPSLYASTPGAHGACYAFEAIDLSHRPDQRPVTSRSTEIDRANEQAKALRRLLMMIDAVVDHPAVTLTISGWNDRFVKSGLIPVNPWR